MPYAVAAAAIAAGGALYSADQSKSAANEQVGATNKSIDAQNRQLAQTRADNAPFLQTGTIANARLAQLLGLTPTAGTATAGYIPQDKFDAQAYLAANPDVAADPVWGGANAYQHYIQHGMKEGRQGYQAGGNSLDLTNAPLLRKFTAEDLNNDAVYQSGLQFGASQGQDAINARSMQAGNYDSGVTLKALTRFNSDYASTKANDAYNRFTNDQNNTFNKLSGISGTGQVATNQVASAGTNNVNAVSGALTDAGNARAAGIVGGANAWGNAGASANNSINNYQNSQLLQKLLAQQGGGSYNYTSGNFGGADVGGVGGAPY